LDQPKKRAHGTSCAIEPPKNSQRGLNMAYRNRGIVG
jgi:hypothetical protein